MAMLFGTAWALQRENCLWPLPLGEAGRRPGEGALRCVTFDKSTLTPTLSQRERENKRRPLRCKTTAAKLVLNTIAIHGPRPRMRANESPLGQHPKTPKFFGVADRRIVRRQTLSTVC